MEPRRLSGLHGRDIGARRVVKTGRTERRAERKRIPVESIWDFFRNVNELAYASDMDSYEILYMNRKTLETYGISDISELKGRKCYEVFYGNGFPCAMCSNEELSEGEFVERKYFNPALNRHFLILATMARENGRRIHFELAIDVSKDENARKTLGRHKNLEAYVNEGIKRAACEPDPNKSIDIVLEFLGKGLHGDRSYVFEKNEAGGDDNTYEWVAAGVTPQKDNLQNVPPEVCANWYRCFREDRNVMFDDIEKMRDDDPLPYENLKNQNIHSIVVVPLYVDNCLIGFYGIDNPPELDVEDVCSMLQIVGYFLGSLLKRRNMMDQLRELSLHDQLTMLGNRHAMEEYVAAMDSGMSLGIVYCDITGLKRMNDTMGHKMGDELIRRAARSLKCALGGYGLFRIGGDELLAICVDVDRETLQERVALLKQKTAENSVNLAVGWAWEEAFENNLQKIMNKAEELMYREKNEYYRRAGIDRRR